MHVVFVRSALVSALLVSVALSGCIGVRNMPELKSALGVVEPEESLPALVPMAKAMAFPTTVKVGQEVTFTSAGSSDPEGARIVALWNFNDGTRGTGAEVKHAFAAPGDYRVELTISDPDGLWDVAAVDVKVLPLNLPPTASIKVLDTRGADASRTTPGAPLVFRAVAEDPEAAPLTLAWDFGDGSVATEAEAKHAWTSPGRWTVTLRATDAGGAVNRTTAVVAVDYVDTRSGVLAAGDAPATVGFPGGPATTLVATLSYDAAFGSNDLRLRLVDARGEVLGTTTTAPGATSDGAFVEAIALDGTALAAAAPGDWSLVVERVGGVRVPFTVSIALTY